MFLFLLISLHVHFFPHNTTNPEWVLIEGVITDEENNEPVPYATVRVQRTSVGTISNEEGRFLLRNCFKTYHTRFSMMESKAK